MGRKNHRRRRPQAMRRMDGTRGQKRPPAPPIEQMVMPHGRCLRSRKLRFHAHEIERALEQAKANRRSKGQMYVEERFYECKTEEGGCGSWHLTSRREYAQRGTS